MALASMWGGLALSYKVASLPPSFAVIAIATAFFALAALRVRLRSDFDPQQRVTAGSVSRIEA
jgi:zinc/manganese transport system permease protein